MVLGQSGQVQRIYQQKNKMRTLNWTKREFEAYVLLYAAHCNYFETKE